MFYHYRAYNANGEIVKGTIEADSEVRAEEALWQANLVIVSLRKQFQLPTLDELLPTFFGIKRADIITFSRQLATLLRSGVPLLQALRMLRDQVSKATLRKVLDHIISLVQGGNLFSQACAEHPDIFPPAYRRLLPIAEETGNLDHILTQLAIHLEKEAVTAQKIQGAIRYPAMVMVLALVAVVVLINLVLPAMAGLLKEFGGELPLVTRLVIGFSNFVTQWGLHLLLGLLVLGAAAVWYGRTPEGALKWDKFLLRLPVYGGVKIKSSIARLTRTLALLLSSGVSLTESLDLLIQTTEGPALRKALTEVRADVLAGHSLADALANRPIMPRLLTQMIGVGEQTGELQANCDALSLFYEEEADRAVANLTGVIEPAMILVVGGIVGLIAVAVITPMYSLISTIK